MKKLFSILTCLMLTVGVLTTPVFASGQITTSTIEEIPTATASPGNTSEAFTEALQPYAEQSSQDMNYYSNIVLGDSAGVTTQQVSQKIIRKAYEVADLFRSVAIPVVIAAFVVSVISAIFGAVSQRKTVIPGLLGMLFCGIGFVCIVYAPQILIFFGRWLWS